MKQTITVIIVTYNGATWIAQCLRSLTGRAREIIVVDNGSADDTTAIVRSFAGVELIEPGRNLGFGLGNNLAIGLALARGAPYVLLLNQDAYMPPGVLETLVAYMDDHPNVGACSPLHCGADERGIDAKTWRYYLAQEGAQMLGDSLGGRLQTAYPTAGVNAAIWLVRASVFQRVGGFDPLYFMYGEDDDLLARMQFHGVRFALLPRAVAVHLHQSPPSKPMRGWRRLRFRAERARALLLKTIKRPEHSATHALALLVAHGFLQPLADVLINRRLGELIAAWVGALRVLAEFAAVRRHTVLTRTVGPHFLDVPPG